MPTSEADCPFCDIVRGNDPDAREIYRDEYVVAFFPTEPAVLGHTLVVPRPHVECVWELDPALAASLGVATVALSKAVRRSIAPDGLNLIQSNGAVASQTVSHVHVHILPRWEGDEIGPVWPAETNYSEQAKDDALDALRAECRTLMADMPRRD